MSRQRTAAVAGLEKTIVESRRKARMEKTIRSFQIRDLFLSHAKALIATPEQQLLHDILGSQSTCPRQIHSPL
jgi:hypothetical protein